MSDNPLSGLSIPALSDIAREVVARLGTGTIDLSSPLQRKRVEQFIEFALGSAITCELESALHHATGRAITHVFRVMRDADYQEKKRLRREERRLKRQEAKRLKEEPERAAYLKSKERLARSAPKGPVQ
jgi:hypothetical protein